MKLKKILLPILFLAVAITAMAFTYVGKSNVKIIAKSAEISLSYYFIYVGPSPASSFSDYTNPANYVLLPPDQNPNEYCEYGYDAVCLILCEGAYHLGVFRPDFSDTTWGSAYWGLYNFYNYGYTATNSVYLKPL